MKETFVRYGKLKSTKQKGFRESDSFHSPPCGKGFYAFPFGYEEMCLVRSLEKTQPKITNSLPTITKYKRNRWFNQITQEYHDNVYDWETKDIWKQKRKFTLEKTDLIWHHLKSTTKVVDILDSSKDWVLTTVEVWRKSFNKELLKNKMRTWKECGRGDIKNIKSNGWFSLDHLEVFIVKKKI